MTKNNIEKKSVHRGAFLVLKEGSGPVIPRGFPAPKEGWIAGIPVSVKALGIDKQTVKAMLTSELFEEAK